jgi:hypothetical protein
MKNTAKPSTEIAPFTAVNGPRAGSVTSRQSGKANAIDTTAVMTVPSA